MNDDISRASLRAREIVRMEEEEKVHPPPPAKKRETPDIEIGS